MDMMRRLRNGALFVCALITVVYVVAVMFN